jgi:Fe-S cluster assembly protein SufD
MIATGEQEGLYLETFKQLEKELAQKGPSWVHAIRRAAIHSFAELGFPSTHEEEWKYTNVEPLAQTPFRPAVPELSTSVARKVKQLGAEALASCRQVAASWSANYEISLRSLTNLACPRLTFINGRYCPELSTPGTLPSGVRAGSLAAALRSDGQSLEAHLARYADYKTHPFVALNTAFLEDGAFIEIPKGATFKKPIHLLYISKPDGQPTASHPRNLILAGANSQASIIETYLSLEDVEAALRRVSTDGWGGIPPGELAANPPLLGEVYFTNSVTELVVGEGALLDYCKVEEESDASFHYARVQGHQARSSTLTTHSIQLGGSLVREEVQAVLDGEGAESLLHGLYITTGRQHVDNHTTIDHAQPHCNSRELYKGVLEGGSQGVFNGKIIVRKDAQKTDSKQSNKNLLLSDDATAYTKPQLEIFADDVKCTHGATVGQIDPEAVFYLRSRGMALQEARNLLTYGFANDIMERIKYEPLREQLRGGLFARLARTRPAKEA